VLKITEIPEESLRFSARVRLPLPKATKAKKLSTAERAVQRVSRLAEDQHRKYIRALQDSMIWDEEDRSRVPPSPADLSTWSKLPIDALESQLVLLNKGQAASLLQDVGKVVGLPTLRKTILTESAYLRRFRRKPAKVHNRLVFTYVEILLLAGYEGGLKLPGSAKALLG
jgi:hypothetical protein